MRYTLERTRQAVRAINIACCLLFVFLGYIYLYFFQGDLLTMVQHILSHGRTNYHPQLYTPIIITLLTTLGVVISIFVYLPIRVRALAWFPSCWILALFTRISLSIPGMQTNSVSLWWFAITALVYLVSLVLAHLYNQNRNENSSFSTLLAPNLAILALSFSFIFATANTNRRIHDELRLENDAYQQDYDQVLRSTAKQRVLTRPTMAIRTYALSQQGKLGDELFYHPNLLGSDALLPQLIDSLRPHNMPRLVRAHLGGMPLHDMSATNFLRHITRDSLCSEPARQYLLCALLLDRQLDEFRDSLASFYVPKDTLAQFDELLKNIKPWNRKPNPATRTLTLPNLPAHYAEALTLANSLNPQPISVLTPQHNRVNIALQPQDTFLVSQYDNFLQDSLPQNFTKTYWHYYHRK